MKLMINNIDFVKQGETFSIGGIEWVKLDNIGSCALCISRDIILYDIFDKKSNNWETSYLRNSEALKIVEKKIGRDNLVPIERDLTTDDGMKLYGKCEDVISLLTCDEYRKYRDIIPECKSWQWTITADSLKYRLNVRNVESNGTLSYAYAPTSKCGIRPIILLKENTEVNEND